MAIRSPIRIEVVRDKNDGPLCLGLQFEQFVLHFGPDQRIERRERFIHQEDVGVNCQATGQSDPLLHTTGQFVRHACCPGVQADLFKGLERSSFAGLLIDPIHFQTEGGILQNGQVRHQGKRLENHAQLFAAQLDQLIVVHADDIFAIDKNLTEGRLDQSVEHSHHGRFPRTGQPHDDENFAGVNIKAGILDADGRLGFFENCLFIPSLFQ